MAVTNVQDVLDRIANADSAKLQGINAVILFDLTGEGGTQRTVKIADCKVTVEEGQTTPPNLTLTMAHADFVALANGTLNPVAAFMQGKLKASGDMALAMRLQTIMAG